MTNRSETNDLEARLVLVELRQQGIDKELHDIREVVASGYDLLFKMNADRANLIEAVIDYLHRVEERLGPAFLKVFPKHESYLDAFDSVIGKRHEG